MKITIIFMIMATFFIGCSSGGDNSQEVLSESSSSPQPSVADERMRPPKPPSI